MADLAAFPDIERAVMELLGDLAATGTVTPSDLQLKTPFARITKIGGGDTRLIDTTRLDVDAFALTRDSALALAESIRQRMIDFPHLTSHGLIDQVTTDVGPHEISWNDPSLRRFALSFTISARR